MSTKITATELARNLSDILNRVRYKGESFRVLKNGEPIAEIKPTAARTLTWGEFLELWPSLPKPDPDFWNDVEEGHRLMNQPPQEPPAWDC
jgi:prevent-host-death family protein